ncbi:MAG: MFS transporter [Syntrophobacterales bacterium]|nr:MFS transporter [Syntrophobacterales bacterium]
MTDKCSIPGMHSPSGVENGSALRPHFTIIAFLTAIFFFNFTSRILLSPLTPTIERDMGLGHGAMGFFFFFITAGYFISLAGSGFISSRISHRLTIIVSSVAAGFVLIAVCFTETAWGFGACTLALGLVTGIYLPSGIATITGLVDSRQWGKALAIHELAPNLGFIAAPLMVEVLMIWFSWRCVMGVTGVASILVGGSFALYGRGGEFYGEKPNFVLIRHLFMKPSFFVVIILFSLAISSTVGVYSMLPLYLVTNHGIPRVEANTIIAVSRISPLFMVFLGGWAGDRFGAAKTMKVVFFLTGIITTLLGFANTYWIKLIVLFQPVSAVCFFPVGFALLSMTVPPRSRNLAVSLAIPVSFMIGAGLFPAVIGILGDAGLFGSGFIILGISVLAGSIFLNFVTLRDYKGEAI